MTAWVHKGFEEFAKGHCENGGDNLYVNADGVIEIIHRFDVNNDGYVDLIFPNSHGYIERGPTWIYTQAATDGKHWPRRELPNDSSWMSRVADVDGDGCNDLIVVNAENGVTSELKSYIYWGGPDGLADEVTEFATAGAYDVALYDLTGNGLVDLIFPSAWVDHHNGGRPRTIQVFEQMAPRQFVEVSDRYGLIGIAATSVWCEDLTGDGQPDLLVANYRKEFEYETDSFLYRGIPGGGLDAESPICLPTSSAMQATAGDLNGNGWKDIVFTGGHKIYIYWNEQGTFSPDNVTILTAEGLQTMFCIGAIRAEIADVDGDGKNELLVATMKGVEIRKQDDLNTAQTVLPMDSCTWIAVEDLNGNGYPDIVTSRYHDGRVYESSSAIFWNGPDGFAPDRVTWLETTGTMGCAAGDLDGDGKCEIIFNNTMRGWSQFNPDFPAYVYLGNEKNEYSPERRIELPTGGGTNTYVLADLNHNGYPDLVMVVPGGLRIFPGGPDGPRPDDYYDLPDRGNFFHSVVVADFNRDGWLDLIGVGYTYDDKPETMANSTVLFYGSPEGFSAERSEVIPTYSSGGHLVDTNNNGWLDFVYWDKREYIGIYLGGPEGFSSERMLRVDLPGLDTGAGTTNSADLNGNGWPDLIMSISGHYLRKQSGFMILHGGPNGFSADRSTFHGMEASSCTVAVADVNNDGHLDLLVPAYSTQFSRELPASIFWGNGESFDFENPFVLPCDSSCAFEVVDINGNGYRDVLAVCHRNDLGHQVDSLLFWNSAEGLSLERVTSIPALGPHRCSTRDFGNARTREPVERYVSPAYPLQGRRPSSIDWRGETPRNTGLTFELRWAQTQEDLATAQWQGSGGAGTGYEVPGTEITNVPETAGFLQYRATFFSANGCLSPKLSEVSVRMVDQG